MRLFAHQELALAHAAHRPGVLLPPIGLTAQA